MITLIDIKVCYRKGIINSNEDSCADGGPRLPRVKFEGPTNSLMFGFGNFICGFICALEYMERTQLILSTGASGGGTANINPKHTAWTGDPAYLIPNHRLHHIQTRQIFSCY